MKKYDVLGHECSWLPDGYNGKLIWSDEFDADKLDESKWDYRLHMMHKRHEGWHKEGISFDGKSNIIFTVFEKDGRLCTTQLQTGYNFMDEPIENKMDSNYFVWPIGKLKKSKFEHRYGYYECRCQLQKKPGWWIAFWLQSPVQGSSLNPETSGVENDIMESFEPGKVARHMNHCCGCASDQMSISHGNGLDVSLDEYHRFGLLWTEKGYTFYVDGKEDGHSETPVSKIPQFILLSAEVKGYRNKAHVHNKEAEAALGDKFVVDYVRVFDIEE